MTRIGIIGASSQVGSSVAFFLKQFPDVSVVCLLRSAYGKVFFDMLQIEYQFINMQDESDLKQKIGAMDVVLDFAYPAGQLHEVLRRSKDNIAKVLGAIKKGGTYFYMSSIMAYGMPDTDKWISQYRISRTSYSYIKRAIEQFTAAKGRKQGIAIYNFRLGQVHGFLQSVNGSFRKKLGDSDLAKIDGNPDDPVNIIFIQPLCEAILQCVRKEFPPGLYTLVTSPQWTLKQLYEYYLKAYHLPARLIFNPAASVHIKKSFVQKLIIKAKPYRSLLETYVLMQLPMLAVRIKGGFRRSELLQQKNAVLKNLDYIDFNLLGKPPLRILSGTTIEPEKIHQIEQEREKYYNTTLSANYL